MYQGPRWEKGKNKNRLKTKPKQKITSYKNYSTVDGLMNWDCRQRIKTKKSIDVNNREQHKLAASMIESIFQIFPCSRTHTIVPSNFKIDPKKPLARDNEAEGSESDLLFWVLQVVCIFMNTSYSLGGKASKYRTASLSGHTNAYRKQITLSAYVRKLVKFKHNTKLTNQQQKP